MNPRVHTQALRREACRLLRTGDDLQFMLDRITAIEGWILGLQEDERREADAINATGLRPCQHQGKVPNQQTKESVE